VFEHPRVEEQLLLFLPMWDIMGQCNLQEIAEVFKGLHLGDTIDEVTYESDHILFVGNQRGLSLKAGDLVPDFNALREISFKGVV